MLNIRFLAMALMVFAFCSSHAQEPVQNDYSFAISKRMDASPVCSQDQTGTCWSYSTSSLLESEHHRLYGKWIDLSEMYFVRMNYLRRGRAFLRYHGNLSFGEGSLSHDVMHVLREFGALPQTAYSGLTGDKTRHNHGELAQELKRYLRKVLATKTVNAQWEQGYNEILDKHLGPCPTQFEFEGKTYTSRTFADEVLRLEPDDYVSVTSFGIYPYHEMIVLQVPDNHAHGTYLNLPFEEFGSIAQGALEEGFTIAWDCDVTEKGFSSRAGLAVVPTSTVLATGGDRYFSSPGAEVEITAALRDQEFLSQSLTDDHLMHINGMATDQEGTRYYLVKNSWGDDRGYDGYLFASQAYLELNTIALFLHKDALPKSLRVKTDEDMGTP